MTIDWRNRFGRNWITSIRTQMCGSCWAHAATALVEAMVNIEHSLWCSLCEGDIRVGTGKRCADGSNPEFALDFVMANGLIDNGGYLDTYADIPHVTAADRSGRTVRLPVKYVDIGSIVDQKKWIDAIGPIAACFTVWEDFEALGTGVYRRLDTVSVGGQPNFGRIWDGRPFWIGDFSGDGRSDVLFYYPGDDNWWLGSVNGGQLQWTLVGNTAGFGHRINDGRPFWVGRFSRADRDEILFYYPGDDNWWLGTVDNGQLTWALVGNTAGFGHRINDGRPFWIGDFSGDGRSDVLFYYPGDDNWWLGSVNGGQLQWTLVGNTAGFGHRINDGRPFWVGRFSRADRDEILFYYPGDDNWWLGTVDNGQLTWALVGNTAGFGHRINDGRPFWIGDFTGDGRSDVLFYYPGDDNWWLGSVNGGQLQWTLVGNTAGFGHRINDGRPFWIGDFSGLGRSEVLMYYPGDRNWWLGTVNNGQLTWALLGNTAGFGQVWDGRPFWLGRFSRADRVEVIFYFPGDGNWWLGTDVNGSLDWSLVGNTGKPNTVLGGHCVLVVGFHDPDPADPDGYWIIKNSWGTGWGDQGFGKIAYGEVDIDTWAKTGLDTTNPDPWSKRRLHSGNLVESGNGVQHQNFEMFSRAGTQIRHWWRNNDIGSLPWQQAEDFGAQDAANCPAAIASTFNRNFEVIYPSIKGGLHHWYFDQSSGVWRDSGLFGPGGFDTPGFVQSNRHAPGDFELVVRNGSGSLEHWVRHNGHPWIYLPGTWRQSTVFANNIALSGPSLVQVHRVSSGLWSETVEDLHVVAVSTTGAMEHWQLIAGQAWQLLATFGAGIQSQPCMIQGQFGMMDERGSGNLELCVVHNGAIEHWWRPESPGAVWQLAATFGQGLDCVVGLLQGSFGLNLELIAQTQANQLVHFWRDGSGWHQGVTIGSAF